MPDATPTSGALTIRFAALDGAEIGGSVFEPPAGAPVRQAVVINCGGGIPVDYDRRLSHIQVGTSPPAPVPILLAYILPLPITAGSREGQCRPPGRGKAFADGSLS